MYLRSSETAGRKRSSLGWLGMMNMHLLNRSGLAAIVAATAFLTTPAQAQEVAPVTADPAPIVSDAPLPAEPMTAPEATNDPLAPATTTPTARASRSTRPTRATAAPAARAQSSSPSAPSATTNVAPAPAAQVAEALPPVDPAMIAPIPEPVATAPAPTSGDSLLDNDLLPMAGAAGLGLLGLLGAGFAMRRRRRQDDDVMVDETWNEPTMSHPASTPVPAAATTAPVAATAPVMAATPIAASAFSWSENRRPAAPLANGTPISRIETAKRGPTPDNPSLSLKKRLKRAAFFDQRDRAIAAGMAAPVSAMAGLPKAMAKPAAASTQPMPRPDQGVRVSFGRTLQPA